MSSGIAVIAAAALLSACRGVEDAPQGSALSAVPTGPSAIKPSPASVSGSWNWSAIEHLTVPPFVAQVLFLIEPEGPVTQLRCESSGTLMLVQSGTSFSGTGTQAAVCETGGGHVFVSPPSGTAPSVAISDGRITGNALRFVVNPGGGDLACPFQGRITEADGATAMALRATGRCIVPGHPQSPVPLDPPPAGTSKTLQWVATRS